MEQWCLEMGFTPRDSDEFRTTFKKVIGRCDNLQKNVWVHTIKHIRPRSEVLLIKKQLLLHKLESSKPTMIEVPVSCLKEYNNYLKVKKDKIILKSVQNEVATKKEMIKEHLKRIESIRAKAVKDEEELKEKLFKLNELQNKKITITRLIDKLTRYQKLLIIMKEPKNILGFDSEDSDLGCRTLLLIKELPKGSECQALLLKLFELIEQSRLSPVSYWDRTELLTSMEKTLVSFNAKLQSSESSLAKELEEANTKLDTLVTLLVEKIGADSNELSEVLKIFKEDVIKKAEEVSNTLVSTKPPYSLDVLRSQAHRLNRLINEKVDELNELMPIENEEISEEIIVIASDTDLPLCLPVEKLYNSLSREIDVFMNMCLCDPGNSVAKYQNLRLDGCSRTEYRKFTDSMEKLRKLVSLMNELPYLKIPSSGAGNYSETKEKIKDVSLTVSQSLTTCDEFLMKVKSDFDRLNNAFKFWRKEPLNEKLTGIDIEGQDIHKWLSSYIETKKMLNHEEWLRKDGQSTFESPVAIFKNALSSTPK